MFIFVLITAIVFFLGWTTWRNLKRRQSESHRLLDDLKLFKPFSGTVQYEHVDIAADYEASFRNRFISAFDETRFKKHYADVYKKARLAGRKQRRDYPLIAKIINDYDALHEYTLSHNSIYVDTQLRDNRDFFDHCLAYPLDEQQRRSIVSDEDNVLVVSSAGSGKTSAIVGKVKYLVEKRGVLPERILLISFTRKAANELTERMATPGLRGYTFHKLALDLIGKTTGEKPSVCDNSDKLIVNMYREMLNDDTFKGNVVALFHDYTVYESDWEREQRERQQSLSALKNNIIEVELPDMDGRSFNVRSQQERQIALALVALGVRFRYEESYEHQVADEMHSQYRPDFSIHYEKDGVPRRLYLEHFGVNAAGMVPSWFAKDKGISYEEANRRYGNSMEWKKAIHEKYNTRLISTSSADFDVGKIKDKLRSLLVAEGVPVFERSNAELYDMLMPKDSPREKSFIRLVATFIALLKSSCKSVDDVASQARKANDVRSLYAIRNIFSPMLDRYTAELHAQGQIDFTDAIVKATKICTQQHPAEYDYIIVDEFQDISIDRYRFLLALRHGAERPARLFCVGDDWQSIYRFSGSDMSLFSQFERYFGATDTHRIETTYRFGEPAVSASAGFIMRNPAQLRKNIHPFLPDSVTEIEFIAYDRAHYCDRIATTIANIPPAKSILLLARYSFDDRLLSCRYKSIREQDRFYYLIGNRKVEFLTVHKSKGLEADYVILLQCNDDTYGFPSKVSDDPTINHLLSQADNCPFAEERRLFYVAVTRAKVKTFVLYDKRFPSNFVGEFLQPETKNNIPAAAFPNQGKKWTMQQDKMLLDMYNSGTGIKSIARRMGRSQTSIVMRLGKLGAAK